MLISRSFSSSVKSYASRLQASQFADAAHFNAREHPWLIHLPQPTAKVIKAIVKQFEKAGTESLETKELWQAPEVKKEHGLEALKQGGDVAELMRRTKEDLFVA